MARSFLIIIILTFFSQQTAAQSQYYYSAGVYTSGMVNLNANSYVPHLTYRSYHGGNIGILFAAEGQGLRFEASADLAMTSYNLNYRHPLYPEYELAHSQKIWSPHYTLSVALKATPSARHQLFFGTGFFIAPETQMKEDFNRAFYNTYYDEDLGRENKRLALKTTGSGRHKNAGGWLLNLTYKNENRRFPFFLRLQHNFYFKRAYRDLKILVFDKTAHGDVIQKSSHRDARLVMQVTFGCHLWHSVNKL